MQHQQIKYINNLHVEEKDQDGDSLDSERLKKQISINSDIKEENEIYKTNKTTDRLLINSLDDLIDISHLVNDNSNSNRSINKILLVDDQEFNLNALEIILKYKLKVDVATICVRALSG